MVILFYALTVIESLLIIGSSTFYIMEPEVMPDELCLNGEAEIGIVMEVIIEVIHFS